MLGDLGVSTLRSIKTMTQFSSLLSIKPTMLPASMLGDYSTSASSAPSCFLIIPTCWEIRFSSRRYSTCFSSFWIIILAILPALMLGYYSMRASSMPSKFFHRRFDLSEVCFL
jgi:hypothetical protein